MNKYVAGLIAAISAAVVGFVIHVGSQGFVKAWVYSRMHGHAVTPSWDVRYIALLTSLEIGIAVVFLYALFRKALPQTRSVVRGLILGVLLLAAQGSLFRQPLMDFIIGNPISVVAVQDGITWVLWLVMCAVAAITFDGVAKNQGFQQRISAE